MRSTIFFLFAAACFLAFRPAYASHVYVYAFQVAELKCGKWIGATSNCLFEGEELWWRQGLEAMTIALSQEAIDAGNAYLMLLQNSGTEPPTVTEFATSGVNQLAFPKFEYLKDKDPTVGFCGTGCNRIALDLSIGTALSGSLAFDTWAQNLSMFGIEGSWKGYSRADGPYPTVSLDYVPVFTGSWMLIGKLSEPSSLQISALGAFLLWVGFGAPRRRSSHVRSMVHYWADRR